MHIGLIGGIGPAATEFYYRGLVRAFARADKSLELTIVQAQIKDLLANFSAGAPDAQAAIFRDLIVRLKAAGAEVAAVTSMAGHFCIQALEPISPLPLRNAIPDLDAALREKGISRIGLIGTRVVMESGVYGGLPSVQVVLPKGESLQAAHDNYVAMALEARATHEQRERLFAIGAELCFKQGADAVALVGTDLFLAFEGHDPGYPVIDSAAIHVEAIARTALTDV